LLFLQILNLCRYVVKQGESVTVRCTFSPREAVQYQIDVPIYLDGQTETAYVNVEVLGEGTHPRLAFDTREVLLAPTPLGVRTTRRFMIVNKVGGCTAVECS
jgi:hypothetical protein